MKLSKSQIWNIVQTFKSALSNVVVNELSATDFSNNSVSYYKKNNSKVFEGLKTLKPYEYQYDASNIETGALDITFYNFLYAFYEYIIINDGVLPDIYTVSTISAMFALTNIKKSDIVIVSSTNETYVNKDGRNTIGSWILIGLGSGGSSKPASHASTHEPFGDDEIGIIAWRYLDDNPTPESNKIIQYVLSSDPETIRLMYPDGTIRKLATSELDVGDVS